MFIKTTCFYQDSSRQIACCACCDISSVSPQYRSCYQKCFRYTTRITNITYHIITIFETHEVGEGMWTHGGGEGVWMCTVGVSDVCWIVPIPILPRNMPTICPVVDSLYNCLTLQLRNLAFIIMAISQNQFVFQAPIKAIRVIVMWYEVCIQMEKCTCAPLFRMVKSPNCIFPCLFCL